MYTIFETTPHVEQIALNERLSGLKSRRPRLRVRRRKSLAVPSQPRKPAVAA
jgi:hypothetical protein